MTETSRIADRVRNILAENLNRTTSEIKPEHDLRHDLGADSLDMIEVVMALEAEFDIAIEDDDAENIKTVKDAIDGVERLAGEKRAA